MTVVSASIALEPSARGPRQGPASRAGTVLMCAIGNLAVLADVIADIPEVTSVARRDDRLEVRGFDTQNLLPRLVELATCCEVEVLALVIVGSGALPEGAGAEARKVPISRGRTGVLAAG